MFASAKRFRERKATWGLFRQLSVAALLVTTSACGITIESTYMHPQVASLDQVAVAAVDWSDCTGVIWGITCSVSITQQNGDVVTEFVPEDREHTRILLPPGEYKTQVFYVAVALWGTWDDEDLLVLQIADDMTFEPGHEYVVNVTYWSSDNVKWGNSWWIDDETTGELAAGGRPPEHLPGFSRNWLYD